MTAAKSPTPGQRVQGLGFQRAADDQAYSENQAERQFSTAPVEMARCIVVAKEPFGKRWSISVEPRVATLPTQWARDAASALRIAYEMSVARGWPVEDRTATRKAGVR